MEYKYGEKEYTYRVLCDFPFIVELKHKHSHQRYLVNCEMKKVVEMVDGSGYVKIFAHEDVDFSAVGDMGHVAQLKLLYAPYGIFVSGFNDDGISVVRWGVGGVGRFGSSTEYVDAFVDIDFQVLLLFQLMGDPFCEGVYNKALRLKQELLDKKSIW